MEELIELLEEIQPDADFENCDTLIDDGILDSFAILSIVSELQDTYDITITPADMGYGVQTERLIYLFIQSRQGL